MRRMTKRGAGRTDRHANGSGTAGAGTGIGYGTGTGTGGGARGGRTVRTTLAVAGALCVVAALPGTATADPGDLPAYAHAEDAEPKKGAASSADGPRIAHGGTYTDTIEPGEKKYWTVELDAKTQAWLSAVALPEPGSKVAYGDGLSLTLEDTDGTTCDSTEVGFRADGAARPLSAAAGRVITPDDDCQDAGVYNFSVERTSEPTSDPSAWPLELRFMREPGLKSITSTTPPDNADLPTTPPAPPTGEPKKLTGGTGFNDAPGMGAGVWKDRLRPGETRFYRVPVDWGRQLALSVEFGTTKTGDDNAYVSEGARVDLYNPARGHLGSEAKPYQADDPAAVPLLAPPAQYVNRYSYTDSVAGAAFAGWYYVAVHAHADLSEVVKGTIPVTLRTTLAGKPAEAPPYDGDAVEAGFGVGRDDEKQAAEGLTPQAAEKSDTLRLVAFAGIGAGTLLLVGLGAWTLLARRRAVPAVAGTPVVPGGGVPQQPYAGPPYHPHGPGQGDPGHGPPQGPR